MDIGEIVQSLEEQVLRPDFLPNLSYHFVSGAFRIAKEALSLSDFQERLVNNVSEIMDVPKDLVKYFYNPFHWEFFNRYNNSPIEIVMQRDSGLLQVVYKINFKYFIGKEILDFSDEIQGKYSEYFNQRIHLFCKNNE